MVLQFCFYLLESISGLVVIACRGASFLIKPHHALGIGLYLCIFSLCGAQLHFIVHRVYLGQHLSCLHLVSFAHRHTFQHASHLEGKISLGGCHHPSRILQLYHVSRGFYCIYTHHSLPFCGCLFCTSAGTQYGYENRENTQEYLHVHSLMFFVHIFGDKVMVYKYTHKGRFL